MSISDLETGQLHTFADFAAAAVPKNIAGVYTIWQGGRFVYVGIGGTRIRYTEPDDEAQPSRPVEGLHGRLKQHRNGDRSGDKFCIYVCDRFVLPSLTPDEIERVAPATCPWTSSPATGSTHTWPSDTSVRTAATRRGRSRTR